LSFVLDLFDKSAGYGTALPLHMFSVPATLRLSSTTFSSEKCISLNFWELWLLVCDLPSTAHPYSANLPPATTVLAQNVTYCPGGGVCYAVNIPASTAENGSGDIYFQISGPSTLSWIALGQGSQMKGSNIFMIYADAAGTNVTLSPRLGTGNSEPSADTTAEVTLLDGSGISDSMMVANVRCRQ
jgi:Cytochrome domain of cellobiose dehydrogenase